MKKYIIYAGMVGLSLLGGTEGFSGELGLSTSPSLIKIVTQDAGEETETRYVILRRSEEEVSVTFSADPDPELEKLSWEFDGGEESTAEGPTEAEPDQNNHIIKYDIDDEGKKLDVKFSTERENASDTVKLQSELEKRQG